MANSDFKIEGTSITLDTDGFDYSYCRTPPTNDSSTKISTTQFVSGGFLSLNGGTITGDLNVNGILNLGGTIKSSTNSMNFIYGPTGAYSLELGSDGKITMITGNNPFATFNSDSINLIAPTTVPTPNPTDSSANAANTLWITNKNYVSGTIGMKTTDLVGSGLHFSSDGTPIGVYIDSNNNTNLIPFATQNWTTTQFLPLSGGTLTGALSVSTGDINITSGNINCYGTITSGQSINAVSGTLSYDIAAGDSSTKIANTKFVDNAVSTETTNRIAADSTKLDLSGGIITGTVQAPTPDPKDNSNTLATTAFVKNITNTLATSSVVNGLTTTTYSGSYGDQGSWTVIKTVDPSTPSGVRYRQMGVTNDFNSEGTQVINLPQILSGIFPGGFGCSTYVISTTVNYIAHDQNAQVFGAPSTTQIIINLNDNDGTDSTFPIRATWWIEGY